MGLKIELQLSLRESVKLHGSDAIFKAGQRGLGGQVKVAFGRSARHGLEGRVPGQKRGIVGILITQGNGKQVLPQQGNEIVLHTAGLAGILQAVGQLFTQTVALVHLPEQQAAPSEVSRPPVKSATISLAERLPKWSWL